MTLPPDRMHPAGISSPDVNGCGRSPKRMLVFLVLACSASGCSFPGRPSIPSSPYPTEAGHGTPAVSSTVSLSSIASPFPSLTPSGGASAWWKPAPGITWQWQLSGKNTDTTFDVDVYDIDLFETSAEVVASLRLEGRRVVCYISAGSWEDGRPDAGNFPKETIGKDYEGWPGEKWLDIRQIERLAPVLRARMDLCKAKGFDAVEPDNVDGFETETGFPLTAADQLRFNRWLAREAHARGLAVALKNDPDQIVDLLPDFDVALTEDCFDQGWCDRTLPFVQNGKPVLDAEYTDTGATLDSFCPRAKELGIRAILKHRNLDAWRQACP
jgi:hypothetical protein